MGIPLIPIIGAASSLLGNIWGAASTAKQNQRQQDFALSMYNRQRQDSLADWAMQNEYNSPQAQMARLRDAGLNPNLVYGNGSAVNQGGSVRASQAQSISPRPFQPDFTGVQNAFMAQADLKIKEAQYDNLKTANTVATQEAALKAAQTAQTIASTERSKFDLGMASELKDTSLEAAVEGLRKLKSETQVLLSRDEREAAANQSTLAKAAEEILSLRLGRSKASAEIESIRKDTRLKQLDIELKEKGIMPGDPLWSRVLARLLEKWLGDSKSSPSWDWKPGKIPDSTLDKMRIPYKSGYELFLENQKR